MDEHYLQELFQKERKKKFFLAILIDFIGYLSYTVPMMAEVFDIFWAPLSGIIVFIMFRRRPKLALIGALASFIEEFSPGFDFIPTTLLIWILIYVKDRQETYDIFVNEQINKM